MIRWHPRSLTGRLALLFALVAGLTFIGVGTYLYRSLSNQLEARDDADLIEKIDIIRLLISQAPSAQAIKNSPQMFVETVAGGDRLKLVVKSGKGDMLFDNSRSGDHMPRAEHMATLPVIRVPAGDVPTRDEIRTIITDHGHTIRAVAAWSRIAKSGEPVEVIVARTRSDRMRLLSTYRDEVLIAILAGALLAAALGYVMVRRGLRPLRMVASQAGSITASKLETRLNVAEAPQELQEMVQVFNEMLDGLQQSFQRLSRFSADIAHDLRTPLNNLMIQTQVALSQPRTLDEYQALLASNVEDYERLTRMTESMLFLARAEHANLAAAKTTLDTHKQLERIAEYFEGVAEDAGVSLRVQATGSVSADPLLFRRAVGNLVVNAIRYTPPGGEILLSGRRVGDITTVSISNPGPGINERHLPRIFDRFYRADASRQDSASSAGLGLAIVKSIMSLHGGHAEAESIPDRMTRFHLIFPNEDGVLLGQE
jgi:two-component system heavy metal sensor histidine kinase CusS